MSFTVSHQDDDVHLTDFEDYDDGHRDVFAEAAAASQLLVYPTRCKVIYSYQVGIYPRITLRK